MTWYVYEVTGTIRAAEFSGIIYKGFHVDLLAELCIYGIIVNLEEGTKRLISTLNNITNCDMVCL